MTAARFAKRTDAISFTIVLGHIMFVFAPLYLAAATAPGPLWMLWWAWVGVGMHGLLNLMHEAVHRHVFRAPGASDMLGRWVLGPLVFANFDFYRTRHWAHHRHLGTPDDTKDAYLVSIAPVALLRLVGRCLLLIEAAGKLRLLGGDGVARRTRGGAWLGRVALVQAGLLGSLVMTALAAHASPVGAIAAYVVVYGYGTAALTTLVATLRAIAEHQPGNDGAPVTGQAALRNLACSPPSRLVFGAYGFAEHATHHREPAAPAYHLSALTDELAQHDPALRPRAGYLATLHALAQPRSKGIQPA